MPHAEWAARSLRARRVSIARATASVITDTAGVAVAELTIAPKLYVARALGAQRKIRPLAIPQRQAALYEGRRRIPELRDLRAGLRGVRATRQPRFRPADRRGAPWRPARWPAGLTAAFDAVRPACPSGASVDWRGQSHPRGRRRVGPPGRCVRRASRPGTRRACTRCGRRRWRWAIGWPSAHRGASRSPGTDSFTPCASSGFRDQRCDVPADGSTAGADELIGGADLAMVYGGQDIVDKYADDPTVFVNGPGGPRS